MQSEDRIEKPRPIAPPDRLERIGNFLDRLAAVAPGVGYERRIWSEALNEIKYLKSAVRSTPERDEATGGAGDRAGKYALSTIRTVLTDYRAAVRQDGRFDRDHVVLDFLRPSNADQNASKAIQLQNMAERSAPGARRSVDAEKLTDTALELLEAKEIGRGVPVKLVGLMLLTGRRAGELLRGSLTAVPANDESELAQRGPALRYSGPSRSGEVVTSTIPVLGDPARIVAAFERLQASYSLVPDLRTANPAISEREIGATINAKTSSRLVGLANQFFSDESGELLNPVELRKAYVAIAFDWYVREQEPGLSFNSFAAETLGHADRDPATVLAYQQFVVAGRTEEFRGAFERANLASAALLEGIAAQETGKLRDFALGHAAKFQAAACRQEIPARSSSTVLVSEQSQPLYKSISVATSTIAKATSRQGTQLEGGEDRQKVSLSKGDSKMQGTDEEVSLTAGPATGPVAIEEQQAEADVVASDPTAQTQETTSQSVVVPERAARASDVRNVVALTGTLESVTAPRGPSSPTKFDVKIGKSVVPVSAFREPGESVKALEIGARIDVEGYLAIRPMTVENRETGALSTRMITGVTANSVAEAEPDSKDRNEAFVRGNIGQNPNFRANVEGKQQSDVAYASLAMGKRGDTVLFADVTAFGSVARDMRDSVGQGDALAVEGRVRLEPGKDGFPATVKIVANEFDIERKKEPKLELTGRITKDGVSVFPGEKKQRVDFTIDTGAEAGEGSDRYKRIRTFTDLTETWPKTLAVNTIVDVVGKEAVDTPSDPSKKPFEYIKATSVALAREQTQTVQEPAIAQSIDPDDLADAAAEATSAKAVGTEAALADAIFDSRLDAGPAALSTTSVAEVATPTQASIDVEALTNQIVETDWDKGPDAKAPTLAAITVAAEIDSIETAELINRFATENGAENDPAIAAIIDELKSAASKGVEQRLDSMMPKVEQSSLPVFEAAEGEIVSDRAAKKLVVDRKLEIFAQSKDGEKIFGRDASGASKEIVSIDRSAFSKTPEAGEVLLTRQGGKDVAERVSPELALGVSD